MDQNINIDKFNSFIRFQNFIQSHFIFNLLNSIQNLVLSDDKEKTLEYFSLFGKYFRYLTEFISLTEILFEDEIEFLNLYLTLQKFRYKERFNYQISIHNFNSQKKEIIKIKPFIICLFVENAIEARLFHLKEHGKLSIEISNMENNLLVTIIDNGISIHESTELNKWKNFDQNVLLDNTLNFYNIEILELNDSQSNHIGTKILLYIDKYCQN
ncbi:MAG: histidine kinase [Saprospiraceae bacterium]